MTIIDLFVPKYKINVLIPMHHLKKMHLDELKLFDPSKKKLDFFYFHELGSETKKHAKFAFVLKIILTLSHGQAAVERGFSLGKSSLQINITEESIVAKKNCTR